MNLEITPGRVFLWFLRLSLFLFSANLMGIIVGSYTWGDRVSRLIRLFDFGAEKNIPTLYSSLALAFCALLLLIIGLAYKRSGHSYLPWFGLAVVFLFLSIDETASLHEALTTIVKESLNTSGLLYFAWVIPYGAALVVFLLVYLPFLLKLPRKPMKLFVLSGATYVSGALGFEMIGGLHADLYGTNDLAYSLLVTAEEFLEMLGIGIFIYTLVDYIAAHIDKVMLTIASNKTRQVPMPNRRPGPGGRGMESAC